MKILTLALLFIAAPVLADEALDRSLQQPAPTTVDATDAYHQALAMLGFGVLAGALLSFTAFQSYEISHRVHVDRLANESCTVQTH